VLVGVSAFLFFVLQLVLHSFILLATQWEVVSLPLPLKMSLALVLLLIEDAPSTDLLIDDSYRLESVGKNDVWVHSCHVHVIYQWLCFEDGALALDDA
jgi:hypothetical protein